MLSKVNTELEAIDVKVMNFNSDIEVNSALI